MEDMIKRIIELDKQAQENLVRANQMTVDSEQRISDMKEKKRNEYMEKARIKIGEMEKKEKVNACLKLKVIENSYKKKYDRIEKIYAENKENWIKTITERVIKD